MALARLRRGLKNRTMSEPEGPVSNQQRPVRAGDELIVGDRHSILSRRAAIIDVLGDDAAPYYLVKWSHDGCIGLAFPGYDVEVIRIPSTPKVEDT